WKVLDLMIELALWNYGTRPASSGMLAILEKVKLAKLGAGKCDPLSGDRSLWETLCATYAGTVNARHSLVHRFAQVDPLTGTLIGRDLAGRELAPLKSEQQEAFCRAVQRAAIAVLSQGMTPRERSDLAWQLDQLHAHHGRPVIGGRQLQPP